MIIACVSKSRWFISILNMSSSFPTIKLIGSHGLLKLGSRSQSDWWWCHLSDCSSSYEFWHSRSTLGPSINYLFLIDVSLCHLHDLLDVDMWFSSQCWSQMHFFQTNMLTIIPTLRSCTLSIAMLNLLMKSQRDLSFPLLDSDQISGWFSWLFLTCKMIQKFSNSLIWYQGSYGQAGEPFLCSIN